MSSQSSPPSSSPPSSSPQAPSALALDQAAKYQSLTKNCSLAMVLLCPAVLAMPPRRLNFGSAGLVAMWAYSANHLAGHYTGRTILDRAFGLPPRAGAGGTGAAGAGAGGGTNGGIDGGTGAGAGSGATGSADTGTFPTEKARLVHLELKRRKEELARAAAAAAGHDCSTTTTATAAGSAAGAVPSSQTDRDGGGAPGVLQKIWMGTEKPDWRESRLREEREKLDAGLGYGTMIVDYFRDAFGMKKGGDGGLKGDGKGE